MKIASEIDVKTHLSDYLEQCQDGPVIVMKDDRPVAVLVSVPDEDELERLVLAHTPRFRSLLDAAEKRIQEGGGVRNEDFWKSLDDSS